MKRTDKPFFYGASTEIFIRAKELRKNETPAEKILWEKLKLKQLGVRFYRQHPINKFIVDFYCHAKLLVIELDGGVHSKIEVSERDEGREYELRNFGLKILRFKNEEVLHNPDAVVEKIKDHLS